MKKYDAIIIGAGHNGLVTAAYLARAGKKVLVLERRHVIGGATVTEELYPGFKYSTCAHVCSSLHPTIIQELELNKYGLQILPFDPILIALVQDGRPLSIWRESRQTIEEIERFSKSDAASYPRFAALMGKLTALLRTLWLTVPPDLAGTKTRDLLTMLKVGWGLRRLGNRDMEEALRILPMSIADLLSEWFESDTLKGMLAASGVLGTFLGPRAQGTSYVFLHHHLGGTAEASGAWGWVRGGMGNLPTAIAESAKHYGAEIRTNAQVALVTVKDGVATSVVLENGDEISTKMVISNTDVRNTFFRLIDPTHLDPHFVLQVRNVRFRGACAKINLALAELPNFNGLRPSGTTPFHHGLIRIAPSVDYLERAFDDAKYGHFSEKPFLEIAVPSVIDPSLAPPGRHVMSVLMQYAPYRLRSGDWEQRREELGDLVVETLSNYAPNLKHAILHRQVLTPVDLEETYSLTEGNFHHGEMSLDQLFIMRPIPGWARYRTPIKNLYLCGASAHPGGGVTGVPGRNAAREILKDWRKVKT